MGKLVNTNMGTARVASTTGYEEFGRCKTGIIWELRDKNITLSGRLIQERVSMSAAKLGLDSFTSSNG